MEKEKILMDKIGYNKYLKRIEKLEEELDDIRMYKGKDAIFQGDNWHDNPTLYEAENKERSLMKQIREMKAKSQNIKIIERKNKSGVIDIGSIVTIEIIYSEDDVEELTFKLIGGETENENEVSINSPLGKNIYGKKENEQVTYKVNHNSFNVVIKKVEE